MLEEVQVTDVASSEPVVAAEPEIQSEVTTEAEPASDTPPPAQEKMIPASQVSKIAAREARQAAEKARQEMQAEYERQRVSQDAAPSQPSSMGGMPQMSQEHFQEQMMAAAHRMSAQMTANQMAKDFESKINAEIQDDPDFGDLYDKMNIAAHPELVIMMNGMDNSGKVVKDLANNPAKFANILMLAKSGMGDFAKIELQKLSQSIKTNLAAQAQPKVKEPLDQLSPSSVGIDNGEMSVSDFMKQPWLRG